MRKIVILTTLLLTFVFTTSCSDSYEAPYGDYSSFSWYSSDEWNEDSKIVNIDNFIIFMDLSQNPISHEWIIPESSKYLNTDFTDTDSIYTDFIIEGAGTTSTESTINVLFTAPGKHEIQLHNVFNDSVAESVKENDSWVVNKIFTVDVFANTNPACKVFKYDNTDPSNPKLVEVLSLTAEEMPSIEDIDSWETVTIEAGEELVYVDQSTIGRPTGRKWYLDGGKPETSSKDSVAIKYNKLGEFTSSMESIRNGEGVPSYTSSKFIPLKVNVIPSTQPFELTGKVSINTSEVISFSVTGEVETIFQQEDFFTVHVTNTDAGFDENIAVASVFVNSSDATIIELTLEAPVYNTDNIELSYSGGKIISVDSRMLSDFGPVPVTMPIGNSVLINNWAGFENASSSGNTTRKADCDGYWVGKENDDLGLPFYRTTDKFYEGVASMRYTSTDGVVTVTLQGSDFSKPNGIPAATYRVSYMVYLETGNTMKSFRSTLQSSDISLLWNIENLPRGEWVEISQVVTVSGIASGIRFDLKIDAEDNLDVSGEQTMYFDTLLWIPLNPRPTS
ncbi:hypothetical protein [Formosa sp. PL04]|uniref:hypothetical protein n=1 Tax=Formosa sp. PL04 TaxID=3081755 RepID=UPI002980D498|nr:hypothetical protein [Formosa sp. PL04]MDW5288085.1 hypothetical protein [Formosa sp. PL04]